MLSLTSSTLPCYRRAWSVFTAGRLPPHPDPASSHWMGCKGRARVASFTPRAGPFLSYAPIILTADISGEHGSHRITGGGKRGEASGSGPAVNSHGSDQRPGQWEQIQQHSFQFSFMRASTGMAIAGTEPRGNIVETCADITIWRHMAQDPWDGNGECQRWLRGSGDWGGRGWGMVEMAKGVGAGWEELDGP